VKELLKLIHICQSDQKNTVLVFYFDSQCSSSSCVCVTAVNRAVRRKDCDKVMENLKFEFQAVI